MRQPFGFLTVASALHDRAALASALSGLTTGLTHLGGVEVDDAMVRPDDPFVVVALTGGTEQAMLRTWRSRHDAAGWEPFIVVAHGGQNSLPAALEALARVQQDGGRGRVVYIGGAHDDEAWEELADVITGVQARRTLADFRIGLVGSPSDWLVASMPPADVVARRWGPHVVPVDIDEALARLRAAEPTPALAHSFASGATGIREPDMVTVDDAARVAPVLAALVGEQELDALTVRCFDLVTDAHTSGCVALADLNERGVVAGCEGDMVSTVTMLWLQLLLGAVPWMANPARVDVRTNRVLLAHCTIARSLVSRYRLRSHFESGLGVAIEGDIEADEVTLVRVGGRDLERLWVAEGEKVSATHEEGLCRTQLHVGLDRGHVRDLLTAPLGNHIVVVPGRHAERIVAWWELFVADRS